MASPRIPRLHVVDHRPEQVDLAVFDDLDRAAAVEGAVGFVHPRADRFALDQLLERRM